MSKAPLTSRLVQYFQACFESDSRERGLWNILGAAHPQRQCIELSAIRMDITRAAIPADPGFAEAAAKAIKLKPRETELLFASHFIVGRYRDPNASSGKARSLIAPVVVYPVSFGGDPEDPVAEVQYRRGELNMPVLTALVEDPEALYGDWMMRPFGEDAMLDLKRRLESIGLPPATLFTQAHGPLPGEAQLKRRQRSARDSWAVTPGAVLLVAERSRSAAGILHELEVIAESGLVSTPMQLVLGLPAQAVNIEPTPPSIINVPGALSRSQQQAVGNAVRQPLSVVIGPPGTGKSHVIAAMALEHFLAEQTVLVVAHSEHAVDVVLEKLVNRFGVSSDAIMRAGKGGYLKELKDVLSRLTSAPLTEKHDQKVLDRETRRQQKQIVKAERRLRRALARSEADGWLCQHEGGWWHRWRVSRARRRVRKGPLLSSRFADIKRRHHLRSRLLTEQVRGRYRGRVNYTLRYHRKELVSFRDALRSRTSGKQQRLFDELDFEVLLRTLPIWLVSLSSLHRVLPLKPGLFDLVVFDEATQCHMAEAIPALIRARRAAVVGDPKQLRHVSFLARAREAEIASRYHAPPGYSYRDQSVLDLADQNLPTQNALARLDEHFRSHPRLIEFSNREFYYGGLRLMTQRPRVDSIPPYVVIPCQGHREGGVNVEEAEALLRHLQQIIEVEKDRPPELATSLGVISFFRDQATHLEREIIRRLPLSAIEHHQIRAGTPFSFQGEERDLILMSCGVSPGEMGGVHTYLNRPDVFNVAVTRSRLQQILFVSVAPDDLPDNSLLQRYLRHVLAERTRSRAVPADQNYERPKLCQALNAAGIRTYTDYMVAGTAIDLMVEREGRFAGIDLVGFPGAIGQALHLNRIRVFERAGLRLIPVSMGEWLWRGEEVVEKIGELLGHTPSPLPVSADAGDPLLSHRQWTAVHQLRHRLAVLDRPRELDQLNDLIEHLRALVHTLNEKLNPGELTQVRYRTVAVEAVLAGVDNLAQVAFLLESLVLLDAGDSEDTDSTVGAPGLAQETRDQLEDLFQQNQSVLKNLATIQQRFAAIRTRGLANTDADTALDELQRMGGYIDRYAASDER